MCVCGGGGRVLTFGMVRLRVRHDLEVRAVDLNRRKHEADDEVEPRVRDVYERAVDATNRVLGRVVQLVMGTRSNKANSLRK